MQRSDFWFDLPEERIARYPCAERDGSRLLVLDPSETSPIAHRQFKDVLGHLREGDLLVFNDTRVIPARLFGFKSSGGKVEILIERMTGTHTALAHCRASRAPKPGAEIALAQDWESAASDDILTVTGRRDALFEIRSSEPLTDLLSRYGHMPLPPYIDRADEQADQERYQTVYAAKEGAVAAPTAGLHFTKALLEAAGNKGVATAFVTLHVGAGTFQPVKVDDIREHAMHSEWIEVSDTVVEAVRACRTRGGRVVAVGTTAVRSLESASQSGEIASFDGDSDIFIFPGYRFRSVDAMITNFHLPESTLIMLVSAFAGREAVMGAYQAAIDESYRFYSYGDAMLVFPQASATNKQGEGDG